MFFNSFSWLKKPSKLQGQSKNIEVLSQCSSTLGIVFNELNTINYDLDISLATTIAIPENETSAKKGPCYTQCMIQHITFFNSNNCRNAKDHIFFSPHSLEIILSSYKKVDTKNGCCVWRVLRLCSCQRLTELEETLGTRTWNLDLPWQCWCDRLDNTNIRLQSALCICKYLCIYIYKCIYIYTRIVYNLYR